MKRYAGDEDNNEKDSKRRGLNIPPNSSIPHHGGQSNQPLPSIPKISAPQGPRYHGTTGRAVSIRANYYRVEFNKPMKIHQYHVEFMPPVEVRRIKAGLLSNLNIGEFILADPQLFVLKDLGEGIYADVASKPRKGEEETMYKVTIKPIKDPSLNIDDMFKIFNLHVKKLMRAMKLEQIGRSYFDPSKAIPVRLRDRIVFDLYPGFFTVLERMQGGIMLNVELKHKVVRNETVMSIIKNKREEAANAVVKNSVVFTVYNKKSYVATYVDYGRTMHNTTFLDNKTNTQKSVYDYMKERYPQAMRDIRDPKQPLIVCEVKKKLPIDTRPPTYLIPELCIVSGLADWMISDFNLMKVFKQHTLIEPEERLKKLGQLISSFSNPALLKAAKVQDWEMRVLQDPVELTARELPYETIIVREPNSTRDKCIPSFNGDWNIPRSRGHVKSELKNGTPINWIVLYPHEFSNMNNFYGAIQEVSFGLGITLGYP